MTASAETRAEARTFWEKVADERRAREALYAELAAAGRPIAMRDRDERRRMRVHLITRDHRDPTTWRTTRFCCDGVLGHNVGPSFAAAMVEAWDAGADVTSARPIDIESIDAVAAEFGVVVTVWVPPEEAAYIDRIATSVR